MLIGNRFLSIVVAVAKVSVVIVLFLFFKSDICLRFSARRCFQLLLRVISIVSVYQEKEDHQFDILS